MARGGQIEIPIAADTSGVEKSVQNGLIEPFEDAEDALKKLEKAGEGVDVDRGMDKAQRATEEFKDELDDARDDLKKLGYAAKDAGDDAKRGMDGAKAGVEDFKSEANSTAREAAASFDGSAESIADAFQEVTANAFGGFGPAGAVAGLAAAAGIGLVTAEFQRQQEEASKTRERLAGLYSEALESGREYIDQSQFIAESNDLRFNPDRMQEWKDLRADANRLGIDENQIIKANSGDLAAQEQVRARITELLDEQQGAQAANAEGAVAVDAGLRGMHRRWLDIAAVTQEQRANVAAAKQSTTEYLMESIANASDATRTFDEFGDSIVTLPDGKQIYIDAQTGHATDNLDAIERKVYGIPNRTVTLTANDSSLAQAMRNWDNWSPKAKTAYVQYKTSDGRNFGGI